MCADGGEEAFVTVNSLDGKEVARQPVGSLQSVAHLKRHLEDKCGYPYECQQILLGSKSLDDACCLCDLGQQPTLTLVRDTGNVSASFFQAARDGKVLVAQTLLSISHPDSLHDMLTKKQDGQTPLLIAAERGHAKICEGILEKAQELGLDLRRLLFATADFGRTCAHAAAYKGDIETCRLIWKAAARQGLLLELLQLESDAGWTPCHFAATSGSVELLDIFPEHVSEATLAGLLLACNTRAGHMPVHCAAERGKFLACERILSMARPEDRERMLAKDLEGRTLRDVLREEGYEYHELPVAASSIPSPVDRRFLLRLWRVSAPHLTFAPLRFLLRTLQEYLPGIQRFLLRLLGEASRSFTGLKAWLLRIALTRKREREVRVGFLIGQADYTEQGPWEKLTHTRQAVHELDSLLRDRCGFQVTVMYDANRNALRMLGCFLAQNLRGLAGGTLLLYYAGHAISAHNDTCLVPTDADADDPSQCTRLGAILRTVDDAVGRDRSRGGGAEGGPVGEPAAKVVVVLDACRGPSGAGGRAACAGRAGPLRLANTEVCIIHSCREEQSVCKAGESGEFSKAFIDALKIPGLTWLEVVEKCRQRCTTHIGDGESRRPPRMSAWNSQALSALVLHNRRLHCQLL